MHNFCADYLIINITIIAILVTDLFLILYSSLSRDVLFLGSDFLFLGVATSFLSVTNSFLQVTSFL